MIWKQVLLSNPVLISSMNKTFAGPTSISPATSSHTMSHDSPHSALDKSLDFNVVSTLNNIFENTQTSLLP